MMWPQCPFRQSRQMRQMRYYLLWQLTKFQMMMFRL
jgi:hypothetical protein